MQRTHSSPVRPSPHGRIRGAALGLLAVGAGLAWLTPTALGQSYQRPLSDFLSTQGTTQVLTAPVPDFAAWTDPANGTMMGIDYAGIANAWTEAASGGTVSYGTRITGTVNETPRPDGRADVQILLHAHNALSYVVGFDPITGANFSDVRFGNLAPAALATGDAALGDCNFQIRIINTAPGAPLPDLFDAFFLGNAGPGVELVFLSFTGQATGTLHAGAIEGVPEGTPGRAGTVQTGIFMSGFHGQVGVNGGFPAEKVRLTVAP